MRCGCTSTSQDEMPEPCQTDLVNRGCTVASSRHRDPMWGDWGAGGLIGKRLTVRTVDLSVNDHTQDTNASKL